MYSIIVHLFNSRGYRTYWYRVRSTFHEATEWSLTLEITCMQLCVRVCVYVLTYVRTYVCIHTVNSFPVSCNPTNGFSLFRLIFFLFLTPDSAQRLCMSNFVSRGGLHTSKCFTFVKWCPLLLHSRNSCFSKTLFSVCYLWRFCSLTCFSLNINHHKTQKL
jgi:hypothetical protein